MQRRIAIVSFALIAACGDPSSSVRDRSDVSADGGTTRLLCGIGIVEAGEDCDDANRFDDDACTNACILARCGDGFVHIGQEDCDDGNRLDADGCLNSCRAATCGDGIARADLEFGDDGFEHCDDGNSADDDACLSGCIAASCGDGIARSDLAQDHPEFEACDDGNDADDDACLSNCRAARCGDGVARRDIDQNSPEFEACDDGNRVDNDACSGSCAVARCGDAIVRADLHPSEPDGEACDDGNLRDTDACTSVCQAARCGDGIVRTDLAVGQPGHDECDDGNLLDSDGCSNECRAPSCGNGRLEPGERCDDGNQVDADACRNTCLPARCGDGVLRSDLLPGAIGYEACDDGNQVQSDACLNSCVRARCGDGVRRTDRREGTLGFEACDDGNQIEDDTCASCRNTCFLHSNCPGGAGRCRVQAGARRGQCFDLRYHRCQSDADCLFSDANDVDTPLVCDRGLCRVREFATAIVGIECALGNAVHNLLCLQPCRNHQECRKPYARCDATRQNHCWYNLCGRPDELSPDFARQVNNGRLAGACAGDHDNPLDGSCFEVGLANNQWVGVCFEGGTLAADARCRWGVRRDQDQLQCGGGLRCTGYDRAGLQHCRSACNPPGGHGSVNCAAGSTCMPGLFNSDTYDWVCIPEAEQCDVISRDSCGDNGRCTVLETHSTTSVCSALVPPQERVGVGAACAANNQCPDGYSCHRSAGCSALCRSIADCAVGQGCSIAPGAVFGGCIPR